MTTAYARKLARIQPFAEVSVAEAEGCWYTDETGRKHLDLLSGCWCSVLGHNHPEFVRRLREQAGRLIHLGTGYLSREVAEGAEALLSTFALDLDLPLGRSAEEGLHGHRPGELSPFGPRLRRLPGRPGPSGLRIRLP